MATLQTRVDNARILNNVDVYQYTDPQALLHSNLIIHQIEDYIVNSIGERFFWDILTVDNTVVNQNEYTLPTITGLFDGANKIESISIQYRTGQEFIKAREVNFETLEHDLDWYNQNQSEADPIYFIADKSVFIYPAPQEQINGAIKFYGIKSLKDVTTLSTNDSDLFAGKIPTKYYYLISDGLEQFILRTLGKTQEAIQSKDRFDNVLLPAIVDKLGNRKVGISSRKSPNIKLR